MREFIIADANRNDITILGDNCTIDVDIGKDNDFELTVPLEDYDSETFKAGHILYCIGTEYGGILNDPTVNTSDNTITFKGDTPRGMLSKKIIEPPANSDYRTTGNVPIGTLMYALFYLYPLGELVKASTDASTPFVYQEKYDRYSTVLEGATKILNGKNYKIEIKAEYDDEGKIFWNVYTVPIVDYTEEIEISQDCEIDFKIMQKTNIFNHMICAGKGELKDRTIVHLYVQADGSIGTTQYYTGADEKVYFYDYSTVESADELKKSGIEKFKEINATDTQEMTFDNLEVFPVNIGDIVGGRDYHTGIAISQKVTNIIYKCQYGAEITEVKVGEK